MATGIFFFLALLFCWSHATACKSLTFVKKVARLPPEYNVTFESFFSINSFCCTFLPLDYDIFPRITTVITLYFPLPTCKFHLCPNTFLISVSVNSDTIHIVLSLNVLLQNEMRLPTGKCPCPSCRLLHLDFIILLAAFFGCHLHAWNYRGAILRKINSGTTAYELLIKR